VALLSLASAQGVEAQTLEETAFFIAKGKDDPGFKEVGDMLIIQNASTPGAFAIKKMSKDDCVLTYTNEVSRPAGAEYITETFYFNNVDADNIVEEDGYFNGRYYRSINLAGDKDTYCLRKMKDGQEVSANCIKKNRIFIEDEPEKRPRYIKAIRYLYDNFCTGKQKKGAF
jgi:hypothetical protein